MAVERLKLLVHRLFSVEFPDRLLCGGELLKEIFRCHVGNHMIQDGSSESGNGAAILFN